MPRIPQVPSQLVVAPFRGSDAVAAGLLTRRRLNSAAWRRLLPDVYLHSESTADHRTWCEAALLAAPPGSAIAQVSAARLFGVDIDPQSEQVHLLVPRKAKPRSHAPLVVRRGTLDCGDVTEVAGLRVTTPARTAFDLARHLPYEQAVAALDMLLRRRCVYLDRLVDYFEQRPRWPGSAAARSALADADPLAESPMESRMRLLIAAGGLPRPVSQYKIMEVTRDGRQRFVARVDFGYPEHRLALEYDGDHHRERLTFRFDMERQNRLYLLGWTVLRFSADDILKYPERTVAQIRSALARTSH